MDYENEASKTELGLLWVPGKDLECPDNGITRDVGVSGDPPHVPGCGVTAKCEPHGRVWRRVETEGVGSPPPLRHQIPYVAPDL